MSAAAILAGIIVAIILVTPFIAFNYWLKSKKLARRSDFLESLTFITLKIDVPRNNEKTPLSAEQFFSSIHGILRDDNIIQEHISFEIVSTVNYIQFYIFLPVHLQDFVEGQIYAQYPDVSIEKVDDYTKSVDVQNMTIALTEIGLNKEDVYPVRTFNNFEVDPLAAITAVLSKLANQEQVWLQLVMKPVNDDWQKKGLNYIKAVKSGSIGKKTGVGHSASRLAQDVFKEIITPGSSGGGGDDGPKELAGPVSEAMSGIETKVTKLGYEVIIRAISISDNPLNAKTRLQSLLGAFKQFNTTNMNGFKSGEVKVNDAKLWSEYVNRNLEKKGNIFNTEELASIYHFPNQSVMTPNLTWAGSKKSEAPVNLPIKGEHDDDQITLLGRTDFRNNEKEFGIKMLDRLQHVYIIGKSGVGKSKLMLNMIKDDIDEGRGVIVVDPHGELADETIAIVPPSRIDDVVVFDPADREFPIAFNLLEQVDDDFKGMVASGFVGIFKKIFGYSWGPRLEHILRNTVLALLDYPDSTMLSIPKMLTEKAFREKVIDYVKDPVIQDFWVNEFGAMDQKFQSEAVSPILNKVGQFLSTPTIRNIVGQKRSSINVRGMMDKQKIFIVNLSRGKIGEDNAALMGAMMITKVQLAAMSRADVTREERPESFLYVDEFQNFATESFSVILSEARKYSLGLTLAHQYVAQMPEEVRDAVFGNVGTIVSFRVGAPDAAALTKELKPFEEEDLVNLEKYHIYIKLLIDGLSPPAFSAFTLSPPEMNNEHREEIYDKSRRKYSTPRNEVEATIEKWSGIKEKMESRLKSREVGEVLRSAQERVNEKKYIPAEPNKVVGERAPEEVKSTVKNSVEPINMEQGSEAAEEITKEKKEYKPKLLKVIGNRAYKEHSQRGGLKWFVGEPLDIAIAREQDRFKKKDEKTELTTEPTVN